MYLLFFNVDLGSRHRVRVRELAVCNVRDAHDIRDLCSEVYVMMARYALHLMYAMYAVRCGVVGVVWFGELKCNPNGDGAVKDLAEGEW